MKAFAFSFLMAGLLQCGPETTVIKCFEATCNAGATVKDLTGLDGCGLVFELNDGTVLIPEKRTYIQAPRPEEDPFYHARLKDGDHVKIGFRSVDLATTCMAGKVVFITCIEMNKNESTH